MLLASEMNISPHQAKKLDTINRNASDSVKKAFEQGELSTDAAFEFSKTDTETQDEALKQLEAEPSKTAKAVRSVIQRQHEEKSKQPEKPMSNENTASCREALVYLSQIKLKLENSRLTETQIKEITEKLSSIYDYLSKLA